MVKYVLRQETLKIIVLDKIYQSQMIIQKDHQVPLIDKNIKRGTILH